MLGSPKWARRLLLGPLLAAALVLVQVPPAVTGIITQSGVRLHVAEQSSLWSDAATWGGAVPTTDEDVTIGAGMTVRINSVTASVGTVTLEDGGTLTFEDGAELIASNVMVHDGGKLKAGTEASPFTGKAYITLTGAPADPNNGQQRSIMVMSSGEMLIYGHTRGPPWVEISDHIAQDGEEATIDAAYDISGWQVGDEIVIGPTDYYSVGGAVKRTITDVTGQVISWSGGVDFRWGKTQYATDAGLSLTAGTFTAPAGTPTELNERGVIQNLTRNFVIRGADDSYWSTNKHGCHVMVMDLTSKVVIDGAELLRCGQAGHLGRYPFHWHLLSYYPDGHAQEGEYKGALAVGDGIFKNSSIHESVQRWVVIHGTDGAVVTDNVGYDILGHALFMEGAVERGNTIAGNAIMKVRAPAPGDRLLNHDAAGGALGAGPTAFWLANPDNIVTGNYAADVDGPGFWNAFPNQGWADLQSVAMAPNSYVMEAFAYNRSQSNRGPGLLGRMVQSNSAGDLTQINYNPGPFTLSRFTATKNGVGAYGHTTGNPTYLEFATAGNVGKAFAGKTDVPDDAIMAGAPNRGIRKGLIVGLSLNNANPDDPSPVETPLVNPVSGVTSYHSTLPVIDTTFMHITPNVTAYGYGSGAHATEDYYENPGIERGTWFDSGNQYIDAVGAWRHPSQNKVNSSPNRTIGLVGALWDPYGSRFGTPDRYHIYDDPFLTYGLTTTNAPYDGGTTPNGKLVADSTDGGTEFYGLSIDGAGVSASWSGEVAGDPNSSEMEFRRLDSIGGSEVGSWDYDNGVGATLGNKHFAAAARGGIYTWRFGARTLATRLVPVISNMYRAEDEFLIGIEFDVSGPVSCKYGRTYTPGPGHTDCGTAVGSIAAVAAGAGDLHYLDTANNLIWVKIKKTGNAFVGTWSTIYQSMALELEQL